MTTGEATWGAKAASGTPIAVFFDRLQSLGTFVVSMFQVHIAQMGPQCEALHHRPTPCKLQTLGSHALDPRSSECVPRRAGERLTKLKAQHVWLPKQC